MKAQEFLDNVAKEASPEYRATAAGIADWYRKFGSLTAPQARAMQINARHSRLGELPEDVNILPEEPSQPPSVIFDGETFIERLRRQSVTIPDADKFDVLTDLLRDIRRACDKAIEQLS